MSVLKHKNENRLNFDTHTVLNGPPVLAVQYHKDRFMQSGQTYVSVTRTPFLYRVIRKSLRDFLPLRYSSRDGHAEGEHVNRGRDTPSFCPALQVLDMSTLGDAAYVNPVIKFLQHTLQHLSIDSRDCLHDPSSQLWHRGHSAPMPHDFPCVSRRDL
jgi:hypothetical protein